MVIATFVKYVPDAESRIAVRGGRLDLSDAGFALDGMDEYGVEQGVRLREAGIATELVAIALGDDASEPALRTALALGADRALLLTADADLDPIAQAAPIAAAVRAAGAALLFVGGKQADWDSAALAPAVAEALGWPLCDWTTALRIDGGDVVCVHDVDDGSEEWRAPLPAVISTQQGLAEPRYPTLPNIMKARKKPLERLAVDAAPRVATLQASLPERSRRRVRLDGDPEAAAAALARALRDEAKVI
jgi:electron transfer flavoprotein beta subunit